MWGRRGWNWICGLALAVPALVMLPDVGRAAGIGIAGILGWSGLFAALCLLSLFLAAAAAILGALAIDSVEEIIAELRGG